MDLILNITIYHIIPPTKNSGNEMLLVAKEVSVPDFANAPGVLKSALRGSDPSCFAVKGRMGPHPGRWGHSAQIPTPSSSKTD